MTAAETGAPIEIDLESQTVRLPDGEDIPFEIEPGRRRDLMLGRDEIDAILADDIGDIRDYESRRRATRAWLDPRLK
jgi:3-isopropylmalate dehydratase small subunit